jgi:hypothetical protein
MMLTFLKLRLAGVGMYIHSTRLLAVEHLGLQGRMREGLHVIVLEDTHSRRDPLTQQLNKHLPCAREFYQRWRLMSRQAYIRTAAVLARFAGETGVEEDGYQDALSVVSVWVVAIPVWRD